MAKIIDFRTRREVAPPPPRDMKMVCTRCGADEWTILIGGRVCCADCEESCPFCVNFKQETLQ